MASLQTTTATPFLLNNIEMGLHQAIASRTPNCNRNRKTEFIPIAGKIPPFVMADRRLWESYVGEMSALAHHQVEWRWHITSWRSTGRILTSCRTTGRILTSCRSEDWILQNQWLIAYEEMKILVITDPTADRMRVMTPVTDADAIDEKQLYRLMQANFESALDARYAIANDMVWSTFIHPLSSLTDTQFFSGVGQTITLVVTFGNSYSSGALVFGGGDKPEGDQSPFDDIMRRGEST